MVNFEHTTLSCIRPIAACSSTIFSQHRDREEVWGESHLAVVCGTVTSPVIVPQATAR